MCVQDTDIDDINNLFYNLLVQPRWVEVCDCQSRGV